MSLQEYEIALCIPNQVEMTKNSTALTSEQSHFPIHTGKRLDSLWETPEIP